jgi:hypothetical protein
MDVQENAPASAEVENDSLSQITALRAEQTETPEPPSETPAQAQPEEPAKAEEPEAPSEESDQEAEERRNALLREIAMDPGLTQQYAQQQYYPPQPQPQYQQPQPAQEQAPTLPFDEFTFDATNPEHMKALVAQQIQEVGNPLFETVEQLNQHFQQEEQAKQQSKLKDAHQQANQKIIEFIDTYVPGFSQITEKVGKGDALSAVERAVFNEAVNAESAYFNAYASQLAQQHNVGFNEAYNYVTHNVQMRADIAQKIGPAIKTYAKELGLVAQPSTAKPKVTPEQKQEMEREMYVESSNAVPAANAGSFEKAHQKGDTLGMIAALRQKQ